MSDTLLSILGITTLILTAGLWIRRELLILSVKSGTIIDKRHIPAHMVIRDPMETDPYNMLGNEPQIHSVPDEYLLVVRGRALNNKSYLVTIRVTEKTYNRARPGDTWTETEDSPT